MNKTSIFWNSKFRLTFLIFSISLLFSSCSASGEPSVEFTLATVPKTLPTEDIWIITDDGAPTTAEFDTLRKFLLDATGREIKLEFPNITAIPTKAFYDSTSNTVVASIVSVNADKSITIGAYAFVRCKDLTSVSLPKAEAIGAYAFSACEDLTSVTLPKVATIETGAFSECSTLTTIILPSVTTIERVGFASCAALTTVIIPNATDIGSHAFNACVALADMTIATESTFLKLDNAFGTLNSDHKSTIRVITSDVIKAADLFQNEGIADENITVK